MLRITKSFLLVGLFIITPLYVYAGREITIGYQGIVESEEELVDGVNGHFKFAICDEDCFTTYWSNDGSSLSGTQPEESVPIPIIKGLFNVLLGDTSNENMGEIPISVFKEAGDQNLYLRVWFDDGENGFEQLTPDQRLSIVPYAVRAEITGDLMDVGSMAMTGNLNLQVDDLSSSGGIAFEIEDPTSTLFSVNQDGTAASRDISLQPLTSLVDLNRFVAGRIFYDGIENKFKACTNANCSEIGLAGATGVADITGVTASTGLSGGGASGAVTLSVDTAVVVTKTGNHTMTGSLTAPTLSATTVSGTDVNATTLTATGAASANSLTVATTATTGGVVMSPTGTGAGNTAEIQFNELVANGTQHVGLKAPDNIISNKIWVLPNADGSSGQVLSTNGSGTLSWATDANAGGDITAVTASTGLTGGATSATATLSLNYSNTLSGNPTLGAGQAVFDSADPSASSQGGILFESTVADTSEGLLTVSALSGDQTWTFPDLTGTVALTENSALGAVTPAAGTFTALAATTSILCSATGTIGWNLVSAANQACTTTCTSACVFGQDTATMAIVDCANVIADVCLCAGAN